MTIINFTAEIDEDDGADEERGSSKTVIIKANGFEVYRVYVSWTREENYEERAIEEFSERLYDKLDRWSKA